MQWIQWARRSRFDILVGGVALALCLAPTPGAAQSVLSDPIDDVFFYSGSLPPGSAVPPDLVAVTAGYSNTVLQLSVDFAPGTLDPQAPGLFFVLPLDTDLDPSTGGNFVAGADKLLFFTGDLASANVCDDIIPIPICSGTLPVEISTDQLSLEVPLGAPILPNGGAVLFGFVAGLFIDGSPATEDNAFDGVASSLEKVLSAQSSPVTPSAVPVVGVLGRLALVGCLAGLSWPLVWRHRTARRPADA